MDIRIRPERPEDRAETERITREAFYNEHVPGCDEHYLLRVLRGCEEYVPELHLVALMNGERVGCAVFTRARVELDAGGTLHTLCLGPIAVRRDRQRRGVARALVERGTSRAREMGFTSVFLYGDPLLYARLGFVPAERFDIRTPQNMYHDALQARPLTQNALADCAGLFFECPAFEVDKEAARLYDETLPPIEKCFQPSQLRFSACASAFRPRGA